MRVSAWWRERRDELLRFGVVGGVALVVDIGLFNLLQFGPGAPLADKVVTAKVVSALVATVGGATFLSAYMPLSLTQMTVVPPSTTSSMPLT